MIQSLQNLKSPIRRPPKVMLSKHQAERNLAFVLEEDEWREFKAEQVCTVIKVGGNR
jgi:hypothetical protein